MNGCPSNSPTIILRDMKNTLESKTYFFANEAELISFGKTFSQKLKGGEILALTGDLGCGKTTFVRGIVAGLGSPASVTSPTFNLVHRYAGGRVNLVHYDLYRLKKLADLETVDLENEIENIGHVLAIEWPAIADPVLPANRTFRLTFSEKNSGREVQVITPQP